MSISEIINNISDEEAKENHHWNLTADAIRALKKEIVGNHLIRNHSVIPLFFNERAVRITDTEQQMTGIDFQSTNHNIDQKTSIGDYRDDMLQFYECIPVELTQNGRITFYKGKATTDVLFVNVNINTNLVWFVNVPMEVMLKIVEINLSTNVLNQIHPFFIKDKRTSQNGSGCYIKMPISRLVDLPGVKVMKINLDEAKL